MPGIENAISARKLSKHFGELKAVDGISFDVKEGEIFGLLGPNGAGKTTTIKMLTTLIPPSSGTAIVAGYGIMANQKEVRKRIGIIFQDPSLDDELTGWENLEFHAILYNIGKKKRTEKIKEVLDLVELLDKKDVLVKDYSGGMKRRLEIARGLIHEPAILFLDEPTVGLDPQTRRKIWDYIKKLNERHSTTVILTTHYIEEADYLCSRVAFVDHGKLVALDTPSKLKDRLGGDVISVQITSNAERYEKVMKKHSWVKTTAMHGDVVALTVKDGDKKIPEIVDIARKGGFDIGSISLRKPSLEDVFIYHTGNAIREESGEGMRGVMRRARARMGGRR